MRISRTARLVSRIMRACGADQIRIEQIVIDSFDSDAGRLGRDIAAAAVLHEQARAKWPHAQSGRIPPQRMARAVQWTPSSSSPPPPHIIPASAPHPMPDIVCKTGADATELPVAAASVVAGSTRRRAVERIHGAIRGAGYHIQEGGRFESDMDGMHRFVYDHYIKHGALPGFVRAGTRPMRRLARHDLRHR